MENQQMATDEKKNTQPILSQEDLLAHWQGHRGLTRRVIDAFPEEEFFTYSIGGMRPFAEMTKELLDIAGPGIQGIVSGDWGAGGEWDHSMEKAGIKTKQDILKKWDEVTEKINRLWPQIKPERFQETDVAFGQYENKIYASLFYFIDNEIHHRGQGYVYLRSLGIEPPPFWEH
ncbi:MAG TPA: DinB family protein [Cyclobacteriaceae bacterium]|nr:DinB family protein [Cyclobacteriaceae bacterium]